MKDLKEVRDKIWDLNVALENAYWSVLNISDPEIGWTEEELNQLDLLLDNCMEPAWYNDAAAAICRMCERQHVDDGDYQ